MALPYFQEEGYVLWRTCKRCTNSHRIADCCGCGREAPTVNILGRELLLCERCEYCVTSEQLENADHMVRLFDSRLTFKEQYVVHACSAMDRGACTPCRGLTDPKYSSLFFCDLQGTLPYSIFANLCSLREDGGSLLLDLGYPFLHSLVTSIVEAEKLSSITDTREYINNLPQILGISAWVGCSYCVRSTFCSGVAMPGSQLCKQCEELTTSLYRLEDSAASAKERLERLMVGDFGDTTRYAVQTAEELRLRLTAKTAQTKAAVQTVRRKKARVLQQRQTIDELRRLVETSTDKRKLVPLLQQAYDGGFLKDNSNVEQILVGMIRGVLGHSRRRYTVAEKGFYSTLLTYGGPFVHDFVSKNLFGMSLKTSRRFRDLGVKFRVGMLQSNVKLAAATLREYNLLNVPFVLSEDGSHAQARLDPVMCDGNLFLYGLSGGLYKFDSMTELWELCQSKRLGYSFYVYTLVPMVDGAPYVPVCVYPNDTSNHTFSYEVMAKNVQQLTSWLAEEGIHVMASAGDGAANYRKMCLSECLRTPATRGITIDHPLIELAIPERQAAPGSGEIDVKACRSGTLDWVHTIWRARQQCVEPDRRLFVGALMHNPFFLKVVDKERREGCTGPELSDFKILYKDLDASDKQAMDATLRLFDIITDKSSGKMVATNKGCRAAMDREVEFYGSRMVLEMWHRFLSIFTVKDMSLEDVIRNCGFCISFLGFWRKSIQCQTKHRLTLKTNFLTSQTRQDVIIACQMVVLTIKYFRLWCLKHNVKLKLPIGRLSSRFSEYVFQFLRCSSKTSSKFSVLSGEHLLKLYFATLKLENDENGWVFPEFKRGAGRGKARMDNSDYEGEYPGDESIKRLLDEGMQQAIDMLKKKLPTGSSKKGQAEYSVWDDILKGEPPKPPPTKAKKQRGKGKKNTAAQAAPKPPGTVLLLRPVDLTSRIGISLAATSPRLGDVQDPLPTENDAADKGEEGACEGDDDEEERGKEAEGDDDEEAQGKEGEEDEVVEDEDAEADDNVIPEVEARPSLRPIRSVVGVRRVTRSMTKSTKRKSPTKKREDNDENEDTDPGVATCESEGGDDGPSVGDYAVGEDDLQAQLKEADDKAKRANRDAEKALNDQICLVMDKIRADVEYENEDGEASDHNGKKRLLSQARDLCRTINSCIHKQDNSRTRGRFFDPAIMPVAMHAIVEDPMQRISENDHVILFQADSEASRGCGFFPVVPELMYRADAKKGLRLVSQLHISDPQGRLIVKYFEPVIKDGQHARVDGCLAYRLPLISDRDTLNTLIDMEDVLTPMNIMHDRATGLYLMKPSQEASLKEYKDNKFRTKSTADKVRVKKRHAARTGWISLLDACLKVCREQGTTPHDAQQSKKRVRLDTASAPAQPAAKSAKVSRDVPARGPAAPVTRQRQETSSAPPPAGVPRQTAGNSVKESAAAAVPAVPSVPRVTRQSQKETAQVATIDSPATTAAMVPVVPATGVERQREDTSSVPSVANVARATARVGSDAASSRPPPAKVGRASALPSTASGSRTGTQKKPAAKNAKVSRDVPVVPATSDVARASALPSTASGSRTGTQQKAAKTGRVDRSLLDPRVRNQKLSKNMGVSVDTASRAVDLGVQYRKQMFQTMLEKVYGPTE